MSSFLPKILIVDDDLVLLGLLREAFEIEKFEVKTLPMATNINQEAETFSPNVILLDQNMPDISGLEACQLLRSHRKNSEIPIVLLSGGSTVPDSEIHRLGIMGTAQKPVEFSTLISLVREVAAK